MTSPTSPPLAYHGIVVTSFSPLFLIVIGVGGVVGAVAVGRLRADNENLKIRSRPPKTASATSKTSCRGGVQWQSVTFWRRRPW